MTYVPGIDVSHYNGVIDWHKVAEAGVKFVYIKCTDGALWEDPRWGINSVGARTAGLKVGSYHFMRPGVTADQVSKFIGCLRSGMMDDLPPALDVEITGVLPTLECAQRIAQELKRVPVIYTNHSIGMGLSKTLGAYPLWLAEYGEATEELPAWETWTFWQHTNIGKVTGITGAVDLDWFNGSLMDFDDFLEHSTVLPT